MQNLPRYNNIISTQGVEVQGVGVQGVRKKVEPGKIGKIFTTLHHFLQ